MLRPSGLTSRLIQVPLRVSIGMVRGSPGGALTSHFSSSSSAACNCVPRSMASTVNKYLFEFIIVARWIVEAGDHSRNRYPYKMQVSSPAPDRASVTDIGLLDDVETGDLTVEPGRVE